jgi:Ca-activated chloride channel family protein
VPGAIRSSHSCRESCDRGRHIAAGLPVALLYAALLAGRGVAQQPLPSPQNPEPSFRFRSGVELVNVNATVSDASGRFVAGLRQEDFIVYEDDQPQAVMHFSAERVPVSLGIVLDTSGSMDGEKIKAAQRALNRFLYDLLDPNDEIFLYRFGDHPILVQGWTSDRQLLARGLGRIATNGGTAMYDAVAQALSLEATAQNRKKALVVISDGNDTSSRTSLPATKALIRDSESLVYAVGIDCVADSDSRTPQQPRFQRRGPIPIPIPLPFPPGKPRGLPLPPPKPVMPPPAPHSPGGGRECSDPVDVTALRDMTDDSGGRTEIVRHPRDLDPATTGIADELSKQYYLGYLSPEKKDGRWHSIRVELRNRNYRVRARRGYVAS